MKPVSDMSSECHRQKEWELCINVCINNNYIYRESYIFTFNNKKKCKSVFMFVYLFFILIVKIQVNSQRNSFSHLKCICRNFTS